jgi:hypothetical protein
MSSLFFNFFKFFVTLLLLFVTPSLPYRSLFFSFFDRDLSRSFPGKRPGEHIDVLETINEEAIQLADRAPVTSPRPATIQEWWMSIFRGRATSIRPAIWKNATVSSAL